MHEYIIKLLSLPDGEKKFTDEFNEIIKNCEYSDISIIFNDTKIKKLVYKYNLFWNNIDNMLLYIKYYQIINLIEIFYNEDKVNFLNNIVKLIEHNKSSELLISILRFYNENNIDIRPIVESITQKKISMRYVLIIKYLYSEEKWNLILEEYFDKLLFFDDELLYTRLLLEKSKYLDKINIAIDNNVSKIASEILKFVLELSGERINQEQVLDFLSTVISELLQNQNINLHEMKKLGTGAFSTAYLIGDKVLKIGKPRTTFKMENNKRYLKPIYRQNIESKLKNEILFCIEIVEKVDTTNITEEDLYFVYKELRNEGFVWIDCKKDNIGRLLKDNRVYYEDLTPDIEATGYLNQNNEVLKANELVILDNDYIYKEEDFKTLMNSRESISKLLFDLDDTVSELEERYQEELKTNRRK